jgi:hypothetical protein
MVFNILPPDIELGILAGFAVAISGYLQAYSKDKKEKFSIDKFTTTVVIGAIAGGLMASFTLVNSSIAIFLTSAGIVAIVDSLVKTIIRVTK